MRRDIFHYLLLQRMCLPKMLILPGVAKNILGIHSGRNSVNYYQLTKKDAAKQLSYIINFTPFLFSFPPAI